MATYNFDFTFEFFNSSFVVDDTVALCCAYFYLDAFAPLGLAEVSANNFSSDVLTYISSYGSFSAISSSWDIANGVRSVSADGYNSFTDTSIESFWPQYGFMSCEGGDSCINSMWDFSYIRAAEVEAFGMNAAAYSTIYAPNGSLTNGSANMLLEGEGTLGFYQTNIYGSGGCNITMVLDGFLTGYGTTLHCPAGDRCEVDCLGYDSCFNLTLDCDDGAICTVYNCDNGGSVGNWCPIGWNETDIGTYQSFSYYDEMMYFIESYMDEWRPRTLDTDDIIWTRNPLTFDKQCLIHFDNATNDYINITNSTFNEYTRDDVANDANYLCFSFRQSFEYSTMDLTEESNANYTIFCDGDESCDDSIFAFSNDSDITMYCRGADACDSTILIGVNKVICAGDDSCDQFIVYDIEEMWCQGSEGCERTDVFMTGKTNTTIYALGADAVEDSHFYNTPGSNYHPNDTYIPDQLSVLTIYSFGYRALYESYLTCSGSMTVCNVYCFGFLFENANETRCQDWFNNYTCSDGAECNFNLNDWSFVSVPPTTTMVTTEGSSTEGSSTEGTSTAGTTVSPQSSDETTTAGDDTDDARSVLFYSVNVYILLVLFHFSCVACDFNC